MDTFRDAIGILSTFVLPLMIVGIPLYGLARRVPVYESFVEGGKEGFTRRRPHHPVPRRDPVRGRHVPRVGRDGGARRLR